MDKVDKDSKGHGNRNRHRLFRSSSPLRPAKLFMGRIMCPLAFPLTMLDLTTPSTDESGRLGAYWAVRRLMFRRLHLHELLIVRLRLSIDIGVPQIEQTRLWIVRRLQEHKLDQACTYYLQTIW